MNQTQTQTTSKTLRLSTLRVASRHAQLPGNSAQDIAAPRAASIVSKALFGDASEICIHHMGSDYRLRITRQDKLILTK